MEKIKPCIMKVLYRYVPLKKKILRANHSSHMSETLRKSIMRRSYLQKKYLKKQINPLEPTKSIKKFFNGLNPFFITDNKLFRKKW